MPNARKGPGAEKDRTSVLYALRFPLVFFGLTLLVTEATFGAVLLRGGFSERVTIWFGSFMFLLFLVTVVAVGLLTYLAPDHLMLGEQDRLTTSRLDALLRSLRSTSGYQLVSDRDAHGEFNQTLLEIAKIVRTDAKSA